ncbi:hypothetical protein M885DRAFT_195807 [Pelagophyceae sp. CCMP2097]|nr:hypothetical protein M885DRAFT_195807 [Pelagophyceae sp. CCMP2097]
MSFESHFSKARPGDLCVEPVQRTRRLAPDSVEEHGRCVPRRRKGPDGVGDLLGLEKMHLLRGVRCDGVEQRRRCKAAFGKGPDEIRELLRLEAVDLCRSGEGHASEQFRGRKPRRRKGPRCVRNLLRSEGRQLRRRFPRDGGQDARARLRSELGDGPGRAGELAALPPEAFGATRTGDLSGNFKRCLFENAPKAGRPRDAPCHQGSAPFNPRDAFAPFNPRDAFAAVSPWPSLSLWTLFQTRRGTNPGNTAPVRRNPATLAEGSKEGHKATTGIFKPAVSNRQFQTGSFKPAVSKRGTVRGSAAFALLTRGSRWTALFQCAPTQFPGYQPSPHSKSAFQAQQPGGTGIFATRRENTADAPAVQGPPSRRTGDGANFSRSELFRNPLKVLSTRTAGGPSTGPRGAVSG